MADPWIIVPVCSTCGVAEIWWLIVGRGGLFTFVSLNDSLHDCVTLLILPE